MKRLPGEDPRSSFTLAVGWLFADLLLGLFMLFFVANTVATRPPLIPSPSPSPHVISSPVQPQLERVFRQITLSVDPDRLLSDQQDAINAVIQQVRAQSFLKGRSAGLVIVYGGAPDDSQVSSAQEVAKKVYAILANLGKQGYVFSRTSYYSPLFLLGTPRNTVVIDVYLFSK